MGWLGWCWLYLSAQPFGCPVPAEWLVDKPGVALSSPPVQSPLTRREAPAWSTARALAATASLVPCLAARGGGHRGAHRARRLSSRTSSDDDKEDPMAEPPNVMDGDSAQMSSSFLLLAPSGSPWHQAAEQEVGLHDLTLRGVVWRCGPRRCRPPRRRWGCAGETRMCRGRLARGMGERSPVAEVRSLLMVVALLASASPPLRPFLLWHGAR